jgi:UDP-N-acetylmuramoyl-L-alanyl-D-glutamate--2,6-diaminopimelate ligase
MRLPLRRILQRLESAGLVVDQPTLDADLDVREISADSRWIEAGTLFCAIRGTTLDGHAYLPQVAMAGAAAALVETYDAGVDLPQIRVSNGRRAAAIAAGEFFGEPWKRLVMIGVTGTNGKTTSVALLRHLLSLRAPAASMGTLGVVSADGRVVPGTEGLTTPGPVETARWLARLAADGVESVSMECSSHALAQERIAALGFDCAVFTNLSRDHLDYHGTLEQYRAAKLLLLELLKPGGTAVVNADDAAWDGVDFAERAVVRFGMAPEADVRGDRVRMGREGMEFFLSTPHGDAGVTLPLFGTYNVSNALGAAAVLGTLGWGVEEIAAGLATLPQVPGRLERVKLPPGAPVVLIDYAHTPDALERALAAARPLARERLIVVFGAGGDRDEGKRSEMGRAAALGADFSVVTSDNPRTEDPERIIYQIESGMGSAARTRVVDRREAIGEALAMAGPDDVILLAGKGHETYQVRGTEKVAFDERAIVREIVEEGEVAR